MDSDELQGAKEELNRLQSQMNSLQQQLYALQQRLGQAAGQPGIRETPIPAPAGSTHGSLENFIGLRLINLIGIIVLVIGLSIGVKYAVDRNLVSESMRIAL